MNWQLRIQDPSGETRTMSLRGDLQRPQAQLTIGRSTDCDVLLRDPTAPPRAATLWTVKPATRSIEHCDSDSPFWLKMLDDTDSCRLGDLLVREVNLPNTIPVTIGESIITLQSHSAAEGLPEQPSSVRHWLTSSEEGKNILWTAKKVATTPLAIYIAGETGTGKEVMANLIHAWSERARGPFVPLHCGALPLSLAESELFGHIKGAFTGATANRPGALMQAHGGTLFLDEIGDLPLDIQVKLLRFLENGEIRPVGSDHCSRVDVRLVCATHFPLKQLVEEGKFRRDLYYRLASVTIEITPLRTRPLDIELLALRFSADLGKMLSARALLRLKAHTWPGNVRELRHALERASGLAGEFSPILEEDAFSFLMTSEDINQNPEMELGAPVLTLKEMERVLLLKALRLANGHRTDAAKILGIARSTIFEMLKRHNIRGPKSKPA